MYLRRRRRAFRRTPSVRRGGGGGEVGKAYLWGGNGGRLASLARSGRGAWWQQEEELAMAGAGGGVGGGTPHGLLRWPWLASLQLAAATTASERPRKIIAWTKRPRGQDLKFVVNTQFFYFVFSAQKLHKNFMDEFV